MKTLDRNRFVEGVDDTCVRPMGNTHRDNRRSAIFSAMQPETGRCAAAVDPLCLAAAPTFAIMALLTVVLGGSGHQSLCSAGQGPSAINGMVPMYLLMSAFNSGPWLKLLFGRPSSRPES